jgi:eukaryotic-like serine/threonine-protein kinase
LLMMVEADIVRRSRDRVGTTLRAKYRLDRLVGVGGMGSVFAATHRNNKNRVAIKILHAELSVNAVIRRRFLREGYIANTVEHPGVVRVLDDDVTEDGSVYLVLDLLEGETMADRQASLFKLSATEVTRVAIELCDILAAAHDKGVIHRDIKPDNVFVTSRGSVKILDFGVAHLREEIVGGGDPPLGVPAITTRSGHSVGTPAYMSPEQALGLKEKIGPASDLWSVGATMFTLLAGRFVHEGAESPGALLVRAATQPVPAIMSIEPTVPAALAEVIDKAMAFEIEDRFQSATELRRELAIVLRAMQSRVNVPPDPDTETDLERATTERPPPPSLGSFDSAPPVALPGAITLHMSTPPMPLVSVSSRRGPRARAFSRWLAAGGMAVAFAAVIFVVVGGARQKHEAVSSVTAPSLPVVVTNAVIAPAATPTTTPTTTTTPPPPPPPSIPTPRPSLSASPTLKKRPLPIRLPIPVSSSPRSTDPLDHP